MIILLGFILLLGCFITIEKEIDCPSNSTDYVYYYPFVNTAFLSIYRDNLDEYLYVLSFQIDLGYIMYKQKIEGGYKIGYYNLFYEYDFIHNKEFYNKYLRG